MVELVLMASIVTLAFVQEDLQARTARSSFLTATKNLAKMVEPAKMYHLMADSIDVTAHMDGRVVIVSK